MKELIKAFGNSPIVKGATISFLLLVFIMFSISYRADLEHFSNKESIFDIGMIIGGMIMLMFLTLMGGVIEYFERRKKK